MKSPRDLLAHCRMCLNKSMLFQHVALPGLHLIAVRWALSSHCCSNPICLSPVQCPWIAASQGLFFSCVRKKKESDTTAWKRWLYQAVIKAATKNTEAQFLYSALEWCPSLNSIVTSVKTSWLPPERYCVQTVVHLCCHSMGNAVFEVPKILFCNCSLTLPDLQCNGNVKGYRKPNLKPLSALFAVWVILWLQCVQNRVITL